MQYNICVFPGCPGQQSLRWNNSWLLSTINWLSLLINLKSKNEILICDTPIDSLLFDFDKRSLFHFLRKGPELTMYLRFYLAFIHNFKALLSTFVCHIHLSPLVPPLQMHFCVCGAFAGISSFILFGRLCVYVCVYTYAHFLTFEWQLLNKLWKELNLTVDSCLVGFLLENRWFIAVVATHFRWSLVFIYINLQTHIIFHAFQLKFESCKAHVCCKFIRKDIYQKAC